MEEVLPNALLIGVDYNSFWELDPSTIKPFNKAFDLRMKLNDHEAWRSGLYMQQAVASAMNKKNKYPKKPFGSETKEVTMTAEQIKNKMMTTMMNHNSRFRKEG